jgi:DNA-binding NarL/FixJ family response regulator
MGFRAPYDIAAGMPTIRRNDGGRGTRDFASPRRPARRVSTHPRVMFVGADPADVRLARNVLEEDAQAQLSVVPDARRAIPLLMAATGAAPALVVVDVDLDAGGEEILHAIRTSAKLRGVPVIVLSGQESDFGPAYDAGASCVMPRPRSLDGFFDAMRAIQRFWLENAVLPQK